jgi:hypothetical protein
MSLRIIIPFFTILFSSCVSSKVLEKRMEYEVSHYNLESIDTLVDIGCGYAYMDRFISNKFKNLSFVLEDLPKDIWGNDLKKALKKM